MTEPLMLTDPLVADLSAFLAQARLSDGRVFCIVPGDRVAQAILNWQRDKVFDEIEGDWIDRVDLAHTPDLGGDVEVKTIGAEEAFRLRHRQTGVVALEETREAAWRSLNRKVREHLRNREGGDGA